MALSNQTLQSKGKNFTRGWTTRHWVKQATARKARRAVAKALKMGDEVGVDKLRRGYTW